MGKVLRFLVALLVDFGVNVFALAVSFSIWREFEYQRFSKDYWVRAYIGGALLCTLVVAITVAICHVFSKKTNNASFGLLVGLFFVVLSVLSVCAGTSYPYPAGNRPNWLDQSVGFFTAELQFLRFIICDATVMALCASVLYKLLIGNSRELGA